MSEADFIRAVIARPDDDAPRLIYADWLDEQGQSERAEFIRVQCAIAEKEGLLPEVGPVARVALEVELAALRERDRQLLTLYRDAEGWSYWTRWAPLVFRYLRGCRWSYRRGFVESVVCTAEDWLAHAEAILAAQPIREVTLTTWPLFDWQIANVAPGWPMHRIPQRGEDGERYIALDALEHRWPSVKTWNTPA